MYANTLEDSVAAQREKPEHIEYEESSMQHLSETNALDSGGEPMAPVLQWDV